MRDPTALRFYRTVLAAAMLAIPPLHGEETPDYLSAAFDANRDYWENTLKSENYASATAAAPDFGDKVLWPQLSGKEAFIKESWEGGRLVTWAHPGESGDASGHNPFDPANWLIDGKPADQVTGSMEELFGETTDLLFPASATRYRVDIREKSHASDVPGNQVFRHITVGENASFHGGGDGIGRRVSGNIWVKRDATFNGQGFMAFTGSANTFFRNDNGWGSPGGRISQFLMVGKAAASVEFLGDIQVADRLLLGEGTAIVGINSRLRGGNPLFNRPATLALMDGSIFSKSTNDLRVPDLVVSGTVSGGLPDRPLESDAYLAVSFKNHGNRPYEGPAKPAYRNGPLEMIRVPSLVLESGARLISIPGKDKAARLVITSTATDEGRYRPRLDSERETLTLKNEPDAAKFHSWYDALPHGITVFVSPGASIGNVRFDRLVEGGILVTDPATRAPWSEVGFGEGNAGSGTELFTEIRGLSKDLSY